VKYILLLVLAGCSSASVPTQATDQTAVISCETTGHNLCAHCCEVQPYVDVVNGQLVTRPITTCSSSDLPASWSVAWCMQDCSAEVDSACLP
jgi:hypothetical protein